VTYPLDIIRFRMAVDPTLNTIPQVVRAVIRDEGMGAFYKGLLPSCIGIAPYSSINFAAFDLLKKALPEDLAGNSSAVFVCSLTAAALVRKRAQLRTAARAAGTRRAR
jgi:solute carrier family 25 phosphate transporter 23/24/25/41